MNRQHNLTQLPTKVRIPVQRNATRNSSGWNDSEPESITDSIDRAFSWANTPQGSDYYRDLARRYDHIQNGYSLLIQQPLCHTHQT